MRLEKISIKNFKSIDNLDNFELIDKNITAFIGGNGCGKTNLLHAINSLKKDDELVDTNLHEKANKSDEIEISAEISFDERDLPKLKERSLDLSTIAGYKVKVNKKIGSGSTRAIEPLMCSFDFEKGVTTILSKVVSQIKKLKLSDGSNPAENFIERLVFKPENNSQEILRTLDELTSIINGLGEVDEEYKKAFLETILRAKETLNFNLIKILEADFWNNLDIILLDPKAYTVENYSPLEELQ